MENAKPAISVIMPVYNGDGYLEAAVDSILAQTFSDFELIIVDDASTDGTAGIIRACAARDSRIRRLRLDENRGMADARNAALAVARGKYIAGMDADDIALPQRLAKQWAFMEANPHIGASGACFQRVDNDLSPLTDFAVSQRHGLIVLNMFIGGGFILHSLLFIRRELLLAVGGYEPGRRTIDDLELHSRLMPQTGIRYANLPDSLLLYRRHIAAEGAAQQIDERMQLIAGMRGRMLRQLWGEAPPDCLQRLTRLYLGQKLSWRERRATRQDLLRLTDALISAGWVDEADRPLMAAEVKQRVQQTAPRWQLKLLYWHRHRIGR